MNGLMAIYRLDGSPLERGAMLPLLPSGTEPVFPSPGAPGVLIATGWAAIENEPDGVTVAGAAHLLSHDGAPQAGLRGVLAAYRTHGLDLCAHLDGQFAFVLSDPAHRRVVLAVDRFATRPLFYSVGDDLLVVASQLETFSPKLRAELDSQALLEYILYTVVPSPRTPYRQIRKVEPGTCLVVQSSSVHAATYWQMTYREEHQVGTSEWEQRLRDGIEAAVSRHMAAEPTPDSVGAFLSGGTDSSTVAGMMRKASGKPTRTFSIGYAEAGYDELTFARAAVRHFGFEQHEHVLTAREAFAALPDIVSYYQEPFGNSSVLPTFACARTAREHGVRVLFAGDGGDELFAGNTRYKSDKILGLYQRVPGTLRRRVTDPLLRTIPDHWPLLGLAPRYARRSNLPNPRRFVSYNLLLTAPLATLLTADFLAAIDPTQLLANAEEQYRRSGPRTAELNRLMHLDLKLAIADNDIRKVSGMTELAGVDVRYPLLDTRLAELSGRIPSALKLRGFKTRYLFKRALSEFLPPEILAKKKHGFGAPIAGWMKADPQWRALVGDLLHDPRTQQRGYLQPSVLDSLWRQHQTEESSYYGDMLWPVLMLELWHRRHHDAGGA